MRSTSCFLWFLSLAVVLDSVPSYAQTAGLPAGGDASVASSQQQPELLALLNAPTKRSFSYGAFEGSLFFSPKQIERMKAVLQDYETNGVAPIFSEGLEDGGVIPKPVVPSTYPAYHLSSIVYHGPSDWVVWLNGGRITPKENEGEVQVISVTASRVRFAWSPPYIETLFDQHARSAFADTKTLAHRLALDAPVVFDEAHGKILFDLRPNESFVGGYARVFEGKMAPVELVSAAPLEQAIEAPAQAAAQGDQALRILQELEKNRSQFVPMVSPITPPPNLTPPSQSNLNPNQNPYQ